VKPLPFILLLCLCCSAPLAWFFLHASMFDLPDKITVWNEVSNDGFGGITFSAPVTFDARIAIRQEKFTDQNGDQLMSTAVCYSEGATLAINSQVFFGVSVALEPVDAANDVRALTEIPISDSNLKKVWFS